MARSAYGKFIAVVAACVGIGAVIVLVRHELSRSRMPTPAPSSDASGARLFAQRCAVCHPSGVESAQGPGLGGVVGRKAGSLGGFGFTPAMRHASITWDASSLDRFLTMPAAMVPGTTMPMAVPDANERSAIVAYLSTLGADAAAIASSTYVSPAAFGDYHRDAPGVVHRITLADLPAPYASPSVRNAPSIVDRPENAAPQLPAGFTSSVFATGLENPRLLRVAPNGDIFIAESSAGRVRVLRAKDGASAAESVTIFASGLTRPFGITFYPPGPDPKFVYVANTNSIVRYPYGNGDVVARGPPETIVAALTKTDGGHWTRDIAFSKDGARMFVSVGSGSNVAEGMQTNADEIARAEKHALGASWGEETNRADVLVFDPDGKNLRVFASGIRNCVSLVVQNENLWCTTNERDGLGDDLVPDYVTRVREGAFYGWPWYYLGAHEDPRHAGERADLEKKITVPDVLVQPHSAALGATFYDGAMFPQEYRGDMFVAFHGSWNRAHRAGPKVVRVRFANGNPTLDYEDFMTGFVVDDGHVWARPVGVAVAHDGALIVTEDANNVVWRIAR